MGLMSGFRRVQVAALTWLLLLPAAVAAEDTLKLAIGAPNNWDSGVSDVGLRAGIFKKHGLNLETLYTQGGGETMQAVISGSADLGISAGTAGVGDLYWYVPANSPIQSFKDLDGKTVGYSTNGASTHTTVLALIKHYGVNASPIASGAAAVTLTQAMSGQIDAGWASPPFGLTQLQDGQIRIIARGSDVPSTRDQTVRVHIANANVLAQRRDVIVRYMRAYRESLDFLYDNPEGVRIFAQYAKVSEPLATRIRDEFLPKAAEQPDRVTGIAAMTQDAITFKVLQAPLTEAQLAELIQIPPRN